MNCETNFCADVYSNSLTSQIFSSRLSSVILACLVSLNSRFLKSLLRNASSVISGYRAPSDSLSPPFCLVSMLNSSSILSPSEESCCVSCDRSVSWDRSVSCANPRREDIFLLSIGIFICRHSNAIKFCAEYW